MDNDFVVHSSNLLESLESKPEEIKSDSPLYWYFRLNKIGKVAQTKEMVEEAIDNFNHDNYDYPILKVVSKKHLTREACEIVVRKNGLNLKYVPNRYRDAAMCLTAVQNNGDALSDVPKQVLLGDKGYEICLIAVRNNFKDLAMKYVPECYLQGEKGKTICEAAVQTNGYALEYVPKQLMTKELVRMAIETSFPVKEVVLSDGSHSITKGYGGSFSHSILSIVPKKFMSEELVALSVRLHPETLKFAPAKYVSYELCAEVVKRDPMNLQYVRRPDRNLVECAVQANPQAVLVAPKSMLTLEICRDALLRDPTIPISKLPTSFQKKLEKEFRSETFIKYDPVVLKTPVTQNGKNQEIFPLDKPYIRDLSICGNSVRTIYYISDIHLEHQLARKRGDITKLSSTEIKKRIDKRIAKLFASEPNTQSILLIGGDVADSIELEALFYERLILYIKCHCWWSYSVFAVLGNHELWDSNHTIDKPARTLDEIITDYREVMPHSVNLLENELFIVYKGLSVKILGEDTILNASTEDLAEVCANSTFLLLGGLGFSGLNPVFNAGMGLYRATVSMEEDIARSKRFRSVYEKVLASAKDIQVIVLTHTPMADWSDAHYNPKWIYVSGHTHNNTFLLEHNGAAIFSDNQVGYKSQPWHLNSFTIDMHVYDPFRGYPNGIHQITREQYVEFNRCQGIKMRDMRHSGDLYVLKYDGVYMFVIESTRNLCLLGGGLRHKLDHDIGYYIENLSEYVRKVRRIFGPYYKALSMVSDEIKAIGGSGYIHGCIVDIDWFNHIYLNPFDGKVTPYFAYDMSEKVIFKNVKELLKSSPIQPLLSDGEPMLSRYLDILSEEKKLPILSRKSEDSLELAVVPQVVLDKSMYGPSRIMRSIQYIFDHNVLRIWNDEILAVDDDYQLFSGTNKLLGK